VRRILFKSPNCPTVLSPGSNLGMLFATFIFDDAFYFIVKKGWLF